MAGLKNADDYAKGEKFDGGGLLKWVLLMAGLGAAVLFFVIYLATGGKESSEVFHKGMAYSWLFAVVYFMTLAVGGIFWTLLHNATNSGWGIVVRRLMENLGSVVPFLFVLALPLIFPGTMRNALWEWFDARKDALHHAEEAANHELEEHRHHLQENIESAEKRFAAIEADTQRDLNGATPGETAFLNRRLEDERAKVEKLKATDLSDGALFGELRDKEFKHTNTNLFKKRGYMNPGAWYFRFVMIALALTGVIFTLRTWSLKSDASGDPKYFRWMRRAACGFLPVFAASWTFLVFDWLMALDYTWFSTMWGVYLFAGAALNSMAFLIILLTLLRRAGYLKEVITMEHYHLMGKLLLAFTVFWAYIAFSQFFLIWYANITEETKFYLTRNTAYWNTHAILFLVIGHFFLPFGALLMQGFKKKPTILCGVAVWTLFMHFCDIYWIIIPERGPSLTRHLGDGIQYIVPGNFWTDLLAWVAVAGIFGFFVLRALGNASLFPCRDPRLDESLNVLN